MVGEKAGGRDMRGFDGGGGFEGGLMGAGG